MAEASNFKESKDLGINCTRNNVDFPYISPIKRTIVPAIEDMKKDSFSNDRTTLTSIAEELTTIDNTITQDTYFYLCNADKKQLIRNVIKDIETLKAQKQGLNPDAIGKDCSKYNDNLETCRMAFIKDQEYATVEEYNRNPYTLSKTYYGPTKEDPDIKTEETVVFRYFPTSTSTIVEKPNVKFKILRRFDREVEVVKDNISLSGITKSANQPITAAQKTNITNSFNKMKKELERRKIYLNRKCDGKRSGDTTY